MIDSDMNVLALYAGHYSHDGKLANELYDSFYYIAHSIRLQKPTTVSEFINFIKTLRTRALYFTDTFYITESTGIFADNFFEEETDPLIFSAIRTNENILGYAYINSNGNVSNGAFSKKKVLSDLGNRRIKCIKLFIKHPDREPYMVKYKHVLVLGELPEFRRERYGQLTYFDDKTSSNTFKSYKVECLNNPTVRDAVDWLRENNDTSARTIIAFTDKHATWCFISSNDTDTIVCELYSNLTYRYEKCLVEKMYMLYDKDAAAEFVIIKVDKLPTLFETR